LKEKEMDEAREGKDAKKRKLADDTRISIEKAHAEPAKKKLRRADTDTPLMTLSVAQLKAVAFVVNAESETVFCKLKPDLVDQVGTMIDSNKDIYEKWLAQEPEQPPMALTFVP